MCGAGARHAVLEALTGTRQSVGVGGIDVAHAALQQAIAATSPTAGSTASKRRIRPSVEWAVWAFNNVIAELYRVSRANSAALAAPTLHGSTLLRGRSLTGDHRTAYHVSPEAVRALPVRLSVQPTARAQDVGQLFEITIDLPTLLSTESLLLDVERFHSVLLVLRDSRNLLLKTAMCIVARKMMDYLSHVHLTRAVVPLHCTSAPATEVSDSDVSGGDVKVAAGRSSADQSPPVSADNDTDKARSSGTQRVKTTLLVQAYVDRFEALNIPWMFYSRHRRELLRISQRRHSRAMASRYLTALAGLLHSAANLRMHIDIRNRRHRNDEDDSAASRRRALRMLGRQSRHATDSSVVQPSSSAQAGQGGRSGARIGESNASPTGDSAATRSSAVASSTPQQHAADQRIDPSAPPHPLTVPSPPSIPWTPAICVVEVSARTVSVGWSLFSQPVPCGSVLGDLCKACATAAASTHDADTNSAGRAAGGVGPVGGCKGRPDTILTWLQQRWRAVAYEVQLKACLSATAHSSQQTLGSYQRGVFEVVYSSANDSPSQFTIFGLEPNEAYKVRWRFHFGDRLD